MADFEIGTTYRRKELHDKYGGQRQHGISTPKCHPMIFLFTSDAGRTHGYNDEFQPDGSFWYYGEGQHGDMELTRCNLKVTEHPANDKSLHLFKSIGVGKVRYLGEFNYERHHEGESRDSSGNMRKAIIFELRQI